MSNRPPTDAQIITFGVGLLKAGILPSAIPGRLMDEYSLTPERARELASRALRRHHQRGRGRLSTQPIDKPGE